jgi:hypothetical protein
MSTLAARQSPILPSTGVDFSAALGKLVTFAAGVPAVNASATVPAVGLVIEGNDATHQSSLAFLGGNLPPMRALISSASAQLYQGDTVQQAADGTLTKDVGTGTGRVVVGVLTDPNGAVAGDLAEVTFFTPQIRS